MECILETKTILLYAEQASNLRITGDAHAVCCTVCRISRYTVQNVGYSMSFISFRI